MSNKQSQGNLPITKLKEKQNNTKQNFKFKKKLKEEFLTFEWFQNYSVTLN